jgi:hypothetical protein
VVSWSVVCAARILELDAGWCFCVIVDALRSAALDFKGEKFRLGLVVGCGRQGIGSRTQGAAYNVGPSVGEQKVGSGSFGNPLGPRNVKRRRLTQLPSGMTA